MDYQELATESLSTLGLNKIRTGLAMLGVIIGIGSVIALVSLGQSSQLSVENNIKSLGSNLLTVVPGSQSSGGIRGAPGSQQTLTEADAQAITTSSDITTVQAVAPQYSGRAQVVAGRNNANTEIIGTIPSYAAIHNVEIAEGSFITNGQQIASSKVAVLGPTIAEDLYGTSTVIREDPPSQKPGVYRHRRNGE